METSFWLHISQFLILLGVVFGGLGSYGTWYFDRKLKAETEKQAEFPQQLKIEHVENFPAGEGLDIQLRNAGRVPVSIMASYAAIIDLDYSDSLVGRMEVAETAVFYFTEESAPGDILRVPLNIKVKPNDIERMTIEFMWGGSGSGPSRGGLYAIVVPAIRTSAGILRLDPVNVHLTEGFSLTRENQYRSFELPDLLSKKEAAERAIDWPD